MPLCRKDQAKLDYLNSPEGQHLKARIGTALDELPDTVLPDNFKFDGWKVVDGQFCGTVGEYKAALAKSDTDMGGWHG